MKAAIYEKYGPPEVLQLKDVEKPIPEKNEVLIKVYASTVNRTDCAMLSAKPFIMRFLTGLFTPQKLIPGTDFAGAVEAIGKEVTSYKPGDKVFGFDDSGLSSKAEYMTFPEDKGIAIMPENQSYEQAAASLEGAHYAYNFINKVKIQPKQKVLVNGATGAIGSAALQFLKYADLYVSAVCNTKNINLMKSLGADKVIDYTQEDFTLDEEKYDYVFDTVGKSNFFKCKHLLKKEGVYISSELGPYCQNPFLALITPLTQGKKVKFPIPLDIKRSIQFIKKLIEQNAFAPVIDRVYPLEEIAEAYRFVETGQKTGNVIISLKEKEDLLT